MRRFNVCLVLLATASFYSGCTNGDDDTGDKNVGGSKADSATAGKSSKGGSGGVGGSTKASDNYADNGDGTITDKSTGLMWMKCAVGLSGSDCAEGGASELTWQQSTDYCDALSFAGHDDWRLPEIHEIVSIVDYTRGFLAIDPVVFPATPSEYTWSSSSDARSTDSAWQVRFNFGSVDSGNKTFAYFARCVRGRPLEIGSFEPLVTSGERVVNDAAGGLMWQGCAAGLSGSDCAEGSASKLTWQEAIDYCDALELAGYYDWRLPEIHELVSIVDYTRYEPAIDMAAFPAQPSYSFWSSSSSVYRTGDAWPVNFTIGIVKYVINTNAASARCVRGEP